MCLRIMGCYLFYLKKKNQKVRRDRIDRDRRLQEMEDEDMREEEAVDTFYDRDMVNNIYKNEENEEDRNGERGHHLGINLQTDPRLYTFGGGGNVVLFFKTVILFLSLI